jgi:Xaa-Pro aminopeptidase
MEVAMDSRVSGKTSGQSQTQPKHREVDVINRLAKSEFQNRIHKLREVMARDGTDLFIIYGDEYRRENLRYVSNYWPIFERGMLLVGLDSDPVLLVSPECQHLAWEMSAWPDIRLVREVGMSYVPEEVDFTNTDFTTVGDVVSEIRHGKKRIKVRICGVNAMSVILYEKLKAMISDATIENGDETLQMLRLVKSPKEIEMLKKAWQVCDAGYKAVLDAEIVGLTERQAAAIGEKAARDAGAEQVVFTIFCSGQRTNTVIGRPSEKIIDASDMIMYALSVQYEGYIASDEWPFVANHKPNREQGEFIKRLVEAEDLGVKSIRAGVVQGEVVRKIRDYFRDNGLEQYDLYPPIHGNGLAEAESPYPDENARAAFVSGTGINFDVSLFGLPRVGSNRIEEGFIVTEAGLVVLSPLISSLREQLLGR